MIHIPEALTKIQNDLDKIGAKAIVVGGYVRDALLKNTQSKDIDVEVYGCLDIEKVKDSLKTLASVHEVGKSFGVLKLTLEGYDFDISLPRTESKTGKGHKGFTVCLDKALSYKEAAFRRDFTINSMGYGVKEKKLYDPYNGRKDLEAKILRVVDEKSFVDDPLRVLRAVQFAARFELTMDSKSLPLCQTMVKEGCLKELPKERVFEEIKKLLLRCENPSIGFKLLDEMGALFQEIKALQKVEQNPEYHPEGDVYIHTMMALDVMAKVPCESQDEKLVLMLAVLCHDFGKPMTTKVHEGRIRAIGHETAGLEPTKVFIHTLTNEEALIEAVPPLVEHHLKPSIFYKDKSSDAAIRRLSTKVSIKRLICVAKADFLGRTTASAKEGNYLAGVWLEEKSKLLDVLSSAPKALLLGRDLINCGLIPGVKFKKMLDDAYTAQLDGLFSDINEALAWFDEYMKQ